MGFNIVKQYFFLAIVISFAVSSDPDILSDFLAPPNVTCQFFTFARMWSIVNEDQPLSNFIVSKASIAGFPALNGQSASFAILQYPASSVNPPHIHPRAVELLFLIYGVLDVRFINTTNKPYTQRLQAGDIFVLPKGLVHYQFNCDEIDVAIALSAFGSANAGTVSVPTSVFATGIDDAS